MKSFFVVSMLVVSCVAGAALAGEAGGSCSAGRGPSPLSRESLESFGPAVALGGGGSQSSQLAYGGPYVCKVVGLPSLVTYIGRSLFSKDAAYAEAYRKCYADGNRTCRLPDCL